MMMHNFYPGPSTLHPFFEEAVKSAIDSGILSENHRSRAFASLYKKCWAVLQETWLIPDEFQLLFVSSATETWEIIAQSLLVDEPSLHLYNGSFGEKSLITTNKITNKAVGFPFEDTLNVSQLPDLPFISICQTETSNGTSISNQVLRGIRTKFPRSIIAIDATSSLGGTYLDFSTADIWYSSVQKCMGLPSGMGIILINKKARAIAKMKNIAIHYNDFNSLITNAKKWQTTHTPNTLNIHALAYTQKKSKGIEAIDKEMALRKAGLLKRLKNNELVSSIENSSSTVLAFRCENPELLIIKALKKGIVLGKGYGKWESCSFRIANFPSITDASFEVLVDFLNSNT